jgi:hypothetical protein
VKPTRRQAAVIAAIILLALAWPALPNGALALVGWALAHPTLTAVGLLAYAYPRHTKRVGKAVGLGLLAVVTIRPRAARPATA